MTTQHAKLSASGSSTWSNCGASLRISAGIKEESSDYAAEGTEAHAIAEKCLLSGENAPDTHKELQVYLDYVRELTGGLMIEQRVVFDEWVPGGFGTVDVLIVHGDTAYVVDLKWGKGIRVSAEENSQLQLYALGALQRYQFELGIEKMVLAIVQPRLDYISEWETTAEELLEFGEHIKERAAIALSDDAPATPSEKACQWCRAKAVCRERAASMMALPEQLPERLTLTELARLLPMAERAKAYISDLQAYALKLAEGGQTIPGHKLVEGRATRRFINDAAEILSREGLTDDQIYRKSFQTLSAIEKLLGGKRAAKSVMDEATFKPRGKTQLVNQSDPRPEVNAANVDDFPME